MRGSLTIICLTVALLCSLVAHSLTAQQTELSASQGQEAQAAPEAIKANTIPHARVSGTVLCADSRQPARGAAVMLMHIPTKGEPNGSKQITARTGVAGTYSLDKVDPGEYAVFAVLSGYLSPLDEIQLEHYEVGDPDSKLIKALVTYGTFNVPANGQLIRDIILQRGAAINGRVLYADGSPASQLTVSLEDVNASAKPVKDESSFNIGGMLRGMITQQSLATDDLGHFRISGIRPGTYRIAVVQPPSGEVSEQDQMGALFGNGALNRRAFRIYSGDTIHKKDAKTFDLRSGDEVTGIDIRVPIDGFHNVRGTLAAADGRPINMGDLSLIDAADTSLVFYAKPGADGTFNFPSVPPGTYTLSAQSAYIGSATTGAVSEDAEYMPLTPTNAFANGSTSLIVKDSDLTGIALSLDEAEMPKKALHT